MNLKRCLYLCFFLVSHTLLWGQQAERVNLSGSVVQTATDEPIPNAVVNIVELDMWTTSDIKGKFSFKGIRPGAITITVSCLGYEKAEYTLDLISNISNFKFRMKETSLAIDEVVVTAQAGIKNTATSVINRRAIEHIQAISVSDVLQLLPGVISSNPSLTKINQVTIRDLPNETNGVAHPTASNALGATIIMDGATLSNDMTMQTQSYTSAFDVSSERGADARQIPTNNIESIEVIRGIASAEYGDMTSGAVMITTKAGESPFEVSFTTNPDLKQISAGKGFTIGAKKQDLMNIDLEYAYANTDNRSPVTTFNRYTMNVRYSTIFNRERTPLSFNAYLRGYIGMNKKTEDDDSTDELLYKANDKEFSINLNGVWGLNKPWISGLKYTFAATFGDQYNCEERISSSSIYSPTTSATESGINEGSFLPPLYQIIYKVKGKPISTQAKLTATLNDRYGEIGNNIMLGAEWRMKGNNGDGKSYGEYQPESGVRPLKFKDIPFIHEYAFFIEDRITIPFGKQRVEFTAGLRAANISTDAVDYDMMFDPRMNLRWVLKNKRYEPKGLKYFALRAEWGVQRKMPTMYYLYPDPNYEDEALFTYNQDNYRYVLYKTDILIPDNPNLQTPKNNKINIGADATLFGIKANIDYYNEKMKNAFSTEKMVKPLYYTKYGDMTSEIDLAEYKNGTLYCNGIEQVGYQDSTLFSYSRPGNGGNVKKWGIEYVFDFGRIESILTSLIIDGAYKYEKRHDESFQIVSKSYMGHNYAAIYPGTTSGVANGKIAHKFNTNFRIITHFPELRFVISLTAQCVWMDKTRNTFSYQGENLVYMKDDDGNIVPGNPAKDDKYMKYLNPVQYMDITGTLHDFTAADALKPEFSNFALVSGNKNFLENRLDPYFLLNVNLTKEIGKYATFSFYAKNLTSSNPKRLYRSTGQYQKMNEDIYFGAELKFKF